VHHTSGLRDYTSLLTLAGYRTDADSPTIEETIEMLARQKSLNFTPGEEYSYSNSGYFLLSIIAERTTGKSLNDFAQEYIFKPLG
jgi:CubicO group peptidase (beta-lactamase class C family)